jgi:hypothetical protein
MEKEMYIRKLLVASLVMLSLSAAADFTTVDLGYEVALSDMTVPVTSSGSLVFKECEDCDAKTIRMTPETRFIVNGRTVKLKDFRKQVFQTHDRSSVPVTIMHHLDSDTVASVSVKL